MDPQTVDPVLKDAPDAVVHHIQIWRLGWPHPWGYELGISVCNNVTTSRARCDFIDVNIVSLGQGCT